MAGIFLCRLCLNDEQLLDLFHPELLNSYQLRMYILLCTGIKILPEEENGKYICRTCCNVVEKLYQFRKNALANDKALKAYFNEAYTEPKCNLEDIFNLNKSILDEIDDSRPVTEINSSKSECTFKTSEHFAVHPSVRRLFRKYPNLILSNQLLKVHLSPTVGVEDLKRSKENCIIKRVLPEIGSRELFRPSVARTNENKKQQRIQIPTKPDKIIKVHRVEFPTTKNKNKEHQRKEITSKKGSRNFNENKTKSVDALTKTMTPNDIPWKARKNETQAVLTKEVENMQPMETETNSFCIPKSDSWKVLHSLTNLEKMITNEESVKSTSQQCREPISVNISERSSDLEATENRPQNLRELFRSATSGDDNLPGKEALHRSFADLSATGEPLLKIARIYSNAKVPLDHSKSASDASSNNSEGPLRRKCLGARKLSRYPSDDGVRYIPKLKSYINGVELWETVDEELEFTCDICNKIFDHKSKLKFHKRKVHKKCKICCTMLRSNDALSQHLSICYKKLIENQPILCLRRCDEKSKQDLYEVQKSNLLRSDNAPSDICISDENGHVQETPAMSFKEEEQLHKIADKYRDHMEKTRETSDLANIQITRKRNQVVLEDMYSSLKIWRIPAELSIDETLDARVCIKEVETVEPKKVSWSHVPVKCLGTDKFRCTLPKLATVTVQTNVKQNTIPATNISVDGVNQHARVPCTTEDSTITSSTLVHVAAHCASLNTLETTKNTAMALTSVQHKNVQHKKHSIRHDLNVPTAIDETKFGPSPHPVILNGSTFNLKNVKTDQMHDHYLVYKGKPPTKLTSVPPNANPRSILLKNLDNNNKNQSTSQLNKTPITVKEKQDDVQANSLMPSAVPQSYSIDLQPVPNCVYLQVPGNIVQPQTVRRLQAYKFSAERNAYIPAGDECVGDSKAVKQAHPVLPHRGHKQNGGNASSCSKQLTLNNDMGTTDNSRSLIDQHREYHSRVDVVTVPPNESLPSPRTPLSQILQTQGSTVPHHQQKEGNSYLRVRAPSELNRLNKE